MRVLHGHRTLRLTAAGKVLLVEARRTLQQAGHALAAIREAAAGAPAWCVWRMSAVRCTAACRSAFDASSGASRACAWRCARRPHSSNRRCCGRDRSMSASSSPRLFLPQTCGCTRSTATRWRSHCPAIIHSPPAPHCRWPTLPERSLNDAPALQAFLHAADGRMVATG